MSPGAWVRVRYNVCVRPCGTSKAESLRPCSAAGDVAGRHRPSLVRGHGTAVTARIHIARANSLNCNMLVYILCTWALYSFIDPSGRQVHIECLLRPALSAMLAEWKVMKASTINTA